MRTVTVEEAQRDLSRLHREGDRGETLLISDGGRPIAILLSTQPIPAEGSRRLGFACERAAVPDDFDTVFQSEIIPMFEGGE